MSIHSFLVYLSFVVVATATPGPAVLFIMTQSSMHGWKKSVPAALGNIAGLFCLGLMAVTGLGTILKTSELIFNGVKYAGAAYLIYLGIRMIVRKESTFADAGIQVGSGKNSWTKVFFQAFGVAMSNPKAIVFLTALFPQFIHTGRPLVPQFALLITTLMLLSFGFLMTYAILAHQARAWLGSAKRVKRVNRASGSIFIGFGALLAVSSNK